MPTRERTGPRPIILEARRRMPWMPLQAIQVWADAWADGATPQEATRAVRDHPRYDEWFPGNRRTSGPLRGTVRLGERAYRQTVDGYRQTLNEYGIPPRLVEDRVTALIEGDVSVAEFRQRLNVLYDGVISRAPQIRDAYLRMYGRDTAQADTRDLFASALTGMSLDAVRERIQAANIAGEAARTGLGVNRRRAEDLAALDVDGQALYQQGLNGEGGLAGNLNQDLQTLKNVGSRFGQGFTRRQLEGGLTGSDPNVLNRARSVLDQEASLFSASGSFREDDTRLTGLRAR